MRIGIDAQALIGKKTGVGYYTAGIIKSLAAVDHKNDYKLVLFKFFTNAFTPPLRLDQPNFHYGLIRMLPGRIFGKLLKLNLLPPLDLFLGKRLYIFPNFVSWPLLFSKSIIVIYDLSYLLHGQYSDEQNRKFLTKFVPRSIKKASAIITISENSKREITEHYGVAADRITIAYPAVDLTFFKPAAKPELIRVRKKFTLPEKYILYVGTLEPRKNIVGVLDAYHALPTATKQQYPLVLAGGKGWRDTDIGDKLKSLLAAKENIIQTGYFDEEDLPALYSSATVFVYPSHYEGFGMPPLEAMACGVPVITSNNSSLPEVVGDAGILVDANDTAAITSSILDIVSNAKLAKDLRAKGLERSKMFNWHQSAQNILNIINEVGE